MGKGEKIGEHSASLTYYRDELYFNSIMLKMKRRTSLHSSIKVELTIQVLDLNMFIFNPGGTKAKLCDDNEGSMLFINYHN